MADRQYHTGSAAPSRPASALISWPKPRPSGSRSPTLRLGLPPNHKFVWPLDRIYFFVLLFFSNSVHDSMCRF